MKRKKTTDTSKCIHCKKCTEHCVFLKKYNIDLGNQQMIEQLAYHCQLCGTCSHICPVGIDGRGVILDIRNQKNKKQLSPLNKLEYRLLLKEKVHYKFRNYKHAHGKSVLFPGCNFPAFYPKTTQTAYELLNCYEKTGIAFDCCGKPVAELGKNQEAQTSIQNLNRDLTKRNVRELIVLCPNCYYFLKNKVTIRIISIYQKLLELNIQYKIEQEDLNLFIPCPDRENQEWLSSIRSFLPEEFKIIENVQCCGLGGSARIQEPLLAKKMINVLKQNSYGNIYTYCGSCAGNMSRNKCSNIHHVLVDILETNEKADTKKALWNRMKTKFM